MRGPPIISIDRQSKSFAVFQDDFALLRGFEKYQNEADALAIAKEWCKQMFGDVQPEITYPEFSQKVQTKTASYSTPRASTSSS
jgi:hypothetical protein